MARNLQFQILLRTFNVRLLLLLKAREESAFICGFFFDGIPLGSPEDNANIIKLAISYELSISRTVVFSQPGPGYGLIIELDAEHFLLVGKGFKVEFKAKSNTSVVSRILRFYEKKIADQNGILRTARHLNGDESRSGMWANMPGDESHIGEPGVTIAIRELLNSTCTKLSKLLHNSRPMGLRRSR